MTGRAHARLSASGAHRWLVCTPSVALEEQFEETTSVFAEEGTFAHTLAEVELRKVLLGERARRPAGYRDNEHWSEAMDGYIEDFVTVVQERVAAHRATGAEPHIMLEERLDYSKWAPDGFGTGDVVLVSDLGVEVIDLKYGQGVPVSAIDNPQLRLYGLGAYDQYSLLYDLPNVYMTIVQPRLDSLSTEELTA